MSVRTRFAPSPTGFLHIGGARTALYCWLEARHRGGQFILRIEDTDRERSTDEAVKAILDGMNWLGLDHDEGPFYQTLRMDRYAKVAEDLVRAGKAYYAYEPKDELEGMRAEQMAKGVKPRYAGIYRERSEPMRDDPHRVIRFRNPASGSVVFNDKVKGRIEWSNEELDDLVMVRSDGFPTYNFAVVVDDIDMRVSEVIRGDDHVNNTPRQINIMRALGATPPLYAHLPTVLTQNGEKLSKRYGARGVLQYRDDGYVREAIVNYLARLGWAHGDAEVFSVDEFVAWFDLEGLSSSPGRFDPDKLKWLNHEHLKRLAPEKLAERLSPFLAAAGIGTASGPPVSAVATLLRDRSPTLVDMAEAARYFYQAPPVDRALLDEQINASNRPALIELHRQFATLGWTRESIGAAIKSAASAHGVKPAQVMMPLRALVAGTPKTPAIDAVVELVGREHTRERMAQGLGII